MKPSERSPGVEGVLAIQVAPVAASAKVISVKVPPTSTASVQVLGIAPRHCRAPTPLREARALVLPHGSVYPSRHLTVTRSLIGCARMYASSPSLRAAWATLLASVSAASRIDLEVID